MKWNLNENQFSFLDRLKIASFFLNPKNRWTQGEQVKKLEKAAAEYVGCRYSVFVSSGSTANTLLAMMVKDRVLSSNKNIIILPSVTWQTSCSPWLREGFEPLFIDINLRSLSIDLDKLEENLKVFSNKVAAVFITTLLGFSPDIERILFLKDKYPSVQFMMDNCEGLLSKVTNPSGYEKNVSSFLTSTTSTYFGHQTCSVEGGFVFTNSLEEYIYCLINRNHGMSRSLDMYKDVLGDEIYKRELETHRNTEVDPRFDFYSLGNNYRNTDVNAFIGNLDFARISKYEMDRRSLYELFYSKMNRNHFILPLNEEPSGVSSCIPFSIPIIFNHKRFGVNNILREECIKRLTKLSIETRPIISGNLLRQTPYRQHGSYLKYFNSEVIHNNGLYVGLHSKVTPKQVESLCKELNRIAEDFSKV